MDSKLNRWEVYELLKGNPQYNLKDLKDTDKQELVEGISEYVISKGKI